MGSVCFIVDAMVTGAMLPRHLKSIRESGIANQLLPILVTGTRPHPRLSTIEQRYHTHCLITPSKSLGARINQAALSNQAEWLVIALQKLPLPAHMWSSLYPQLNAYSLDAILIGLAQPSLSKRVLRRFLTSALLLPPYIAVRRTWLERIGGFDPELDELNALNDFLQRLHTCSTRMKTYNGQKLKSDNDPDGTQLSVSQTAFTPPQ